MKFEHGFTEHDFTEVEKVAKVNGYIKALQDVVSYLGKVTEYNPEKRLIDTVPLLETITVTNNEILTLKGILK